MVMNEWISYCPVCDRKISADNVNRHICETHFMNESRNGESIYDVKSARVNNTS